MREWGIDPSLGSESAGVAVRFHLILVSHTTLSTEDTHSFRNYQKATLQLEGAILLLHPILPITYCAVMSTSQSTSSITISDSARRVLFSRHLSTLVPSLSSVRGPLSYQSLASSSESQCFGSAFRLSWFKLLLSKCHLWLLSQAHSVPIGS